MSTFDDMEGVGESPSPVKGKRGRKKGKTYVRAEAVSVDRGRGRPPKEFTKTQRPATSEDTSYLVLECLRAYVAGHTTIVVRLPFNFRRTGGYKGMPKTFYTLKETMWWVECVFGILPLLDWLYKLGKCPVSSKHMLLLSRNNNKTSLFRVMAADREYSSLFTYESTLNKINTIIEEFEEKAKDTEVNRLIKHHDKLYAKSLHHANRKDFLYGRKVRVDDNDKLEKEDAYYSDEPYIPFEEGEF